MSDYGTLRRHWIALPFEAIMLAGGVVMYLQQDWLHVGTCLFTFAISFAPLLFEMIFRVRLPMVYQLVYVLFVFASMFMGEVAQFYRLVRGWDAVIHFMSGVFIGLSAILWLRALLRDTKKYRLSFGMQGLFIVCFAIMIAVAWEVAEFMSDQIFGTTSQDKSLYDTMTDLIYGICGVLLFLFLYGRYSKGRSALGLKRAIETFEQLNR